MHNRWGWECVHLRLDQLAQWHLLGRAPEFIRGPWRCLPGKIDPNGNRSWATYYGGAGGDEGTSCAADQSGNVYLSGSTNSSSGIASGGFMNAFAGGDNDLFLVKFTGSGSRQWGTYYGGADTENDPAIATDVDGNVYMSGTTRSTSGSVPEGTRTPMAALREVRTAPSGTGSWRNSLARARDFGLPTTAVVRMNPEMAVRLTGTAMRTSLARRTVRPGSRPRMVINPQMRVVMHTSSSSTQAVSDSGAPITVGISRRAYVVVPQVLKRW
ncbi:MAG: SBBP repeat-containing protein [Flavobacteriales bacterium]|nr:SBBP repeat-containing protein [Flavobacteriales bacterium]